MSQRRTTVPPTHESSRVVASRTVRADCKEKTEKQSAKRRTVLDNSFHRTDHASAAWTRTPNTTALGTSRARVHVGWKQ
jgi:hypothetical protein